jgi:hypothetical protein
MIQNEIDQFRQRFFDTVIEAEQKKIQEEKKKQAACFHLFNKLGQMNPKGYQERTCSKCGLTDIKHVKVWEGTKGCMIS